MGKSPLRFMVFCAPLLLASCGEGWEVKRVDNVVPYSSRTAGTGVAYVRAKMMPEKELKVEPIATEAVEEVKEPVAPALDAEEIFNEAQTKGSAPAKAVKSKVEAEEHSFNDPKVNKAVAEKVASMNADDVLSDVQKAETATAELSAEEFINQKPKIIENELSNIDKNIDPNVADKDVSIDVAAVSPNSGTPVSDDNVIEVYENKVVKPAKEIMSPKNDYHKINTQGQNDLDDIYNDPFADF
ncbi:MAG: hypothetical protein ACRBB3_01590 [Alphaproteobacteria bacterium]